MRDMRIASLVPSATEALFALGLGDQVVAVTHECDHPPEALGLPRLTRSVIPAGLEPGEVDARVRELTGRGEALYELDEAALAGLAPDLIVTQALCAVCAVSYDDVRAVAERLDSRPDVISLDPGTLGEVLDDLIRLGDATGARERGEAARGRASGAAGSRSGRRCRSAAPARRGPRVARPALRRRPLGAGDDRAGRRAQRRRRARPRLPHGDLVGAGGRAAPGGGGDAVRPVRGRGRRAGAGAPRAARVPGRRARLRGGCRLLVLSPRSPPGRGHRAARAPAAPGSRCPRPAAWAGGS